MSLSRWAHLFSVHRLCPSNKRLEHHLYNPANEDPKLRGRKTASANRSPPLSIGSLISADPSCFLFSLQQFSYSSKMRLSIVIRRTLHHFSEGLGGICHLPHNIECQPLGAGIMLSVLYVSRFGCFAIGESSLNRVVFGSLPFSASSDGSRAYPDSPEGPEKKLSRRDRFFSRSIPDCPLNEGLRFIPIFLIFPGLIAPLHMAFSSLSLGGVP